MEKYQITEFETHGREPIIRKMKDGSLICTFLTGGASEPANDNIVAVARSFDDGKTWTQPETLFSHKSRGVWCTEIFTESEVAFAVVHTYNARCYYRELETFYSETHDNGKTWSEPINFHGAINGCSLRQGITLSNGDILMPLYWQEALDNFDWSHQVNGNYKFRCGVGIRPKGENCWYRYGYIASDDFDLWEPNCVEISDGHIIMYIRNQSGFIYYSESHDYGRTWSGIKKTDIPHSYAKITCFKIKDKIFMLNNAVAEGRTHLELSFSYDGLNFEHICYLEDKDERFFYPHALTDDENRILYVAYENGKSHYLKKFSYDEIGV